MAVRPFDPIKPAMTVGLLTVLAGLATIAVTRSVWLDEFWTLWAVVPAADPAPMVDRWLDDVHPPVFSAWAALLGAPFGDTVIGRRIAVNGAALLLLAMGAGYVSRAYPTRRPFILLFMAGLFGAPPMLLAFGEYRSYFTHTAAFALALIGWRAIRGLERDYDASRDRALLALTSASLLAALSLHYIGGIIASSAALTIVGGLWREGQRKWAVRLMLVALAGWGFMLASAAIQAPRWRGWLDMRWIDTSTSDAFALCLRLLWQAVAGGPALLLLALATVALLARGNVDGRARVDAAVLAAALIISASLLLVLNGVSSILVPRYLLLWVPLLLAMLARLAEPMVHKHWLIAPGIPILLAGSAVAATNAAQGLPGWNDGTARITEIVRNCPETRVWWLSPWRLTPGRHSRTARREERAFAVGYDRQAQSFGFSAAPVPSDGVIPVPSGRCPSLVWVEHPFGPAPTRPEDFLSTGGLRLPVTSGAPRVRLELRRSTLLLRVDPVAARSSDVRLGSVR